jgi:hypothetical protein
MREPFAYMAMILLADKMGADEPINGRPLMVQINNFCAALKNIF